MDVLNLIRINFPNLKIIIFANLIQMNYAQKEKYFASFHEINRFRIFDIVVLDVPLRTQA